jgi:hypothetical protein
METLVVEMDEVGVGDMFYVGESDGYFFDEKAVLVVGGAELVLVVFLEVDGCD